MDRGGSGGRRGSRYSTPVASIPAWLPEGSGWSRVVTPWMAPVQDQGVVLAGIPTHVHWRSEAGMIERNLFLSEARV